MDKIDVVKTVLNDRLYQLPHETEVDVFAPSNIALCKYWGKRDIKLNIPETDSLSISLGDKGARTQLRVLSAASDHLIVNNQVMNLASSFGQRLIHFLDLFRHQTCPRLQITIHTNIPIAAGLASSACGFASIVKAMDKLYDWQLPAEQLSILARLGSGSAARSLWNGFVQWHAGERSDGMDSHGMLLPVTWPELCIGLLIVSETEKPISSRAAMQQTQLTSPLYRIWPAQVGEDLALLHKAIAVKDFIQLGKTAESNALAMHAMMQAASPPICYSSPATKALQQKIWQLRAKGLNVYFTQDAGPNLKLLFLAQDKPEIDREFADTRILIIQPFAY